MAKGSYATSTRRRSKRVTRGAQLRCTSSDEDRANDVDVNNAPRNIVEDDHVTAANVNTPSATKPPSTTV